MFHKILCAVDFSSGSDTALELAVRLGNSVGAELVVAHAWHVPPLFHSGDLPIPNDMLHSMRERAIRSLTSNLDRAKSLGAKHVTSKFVEGVPWHAITELATEDSSFDLIVIGSHGYTGVSRFLLGSVAEKVARHAPCSVLVARGEAVTAFRRVLCPIDFSPGSQPALQLATELATEDIALVHSIELPVWYSGEPQIDDFLANVDIRARQLLDKAAAEIANKTTARVAKRARVGRPAEQILTLLDDDRTFDLVVVGTHGRSGIRRMLLGSVAEKVIRHARISILVARDRTAP